MSLPPPGGNRLDCYGTIRSQETDASLVSAAIKCQAEVAGQRQNSDECPNKEPRLAAGAKSDDKGTERAELATHAQADLAPQL